MPNTAIVSPSSSAPVNRMALEVDSVRLGGGETVVPSWGLKNCACFCFESTAA